MRYRVCHCCNEVLPKEDFFQMTNPDPRRNQPCGYCLGVLNTPKKRRDPIVSPTSRERRNTGRAHAKAHAI